MNQMEMATVEGGSIWGWIGAAFMVIAGIVTAPISVPMAIIGFTTVTIDGLT